MGQYAINADKDVDGLFARAIADLERAAMFAVVGERAGEPSADMKLQAADAVVYFGGRPDQGGKLYSQVRERFGSYCANYSLVCMIGVCEQYLRQLHLLAELAVEQARSEGPIGGDKFEQIRKKAAKDTSRLWRVFEELLEILGKERAEVHSRKWLSSLDAIRNCIVHRGGVVGDGDANRRGEFATTWRRTTLVVDGEPIPSLPFVVNAGQMLSVRFEDRVRSWHVGETVQLTANDCQDMAFTLSYFLLRSEDSSPLGARKDPRVRLEVRNGENH